VVLVALCAVYFVLAVTSLAGKSVTVDELGHLPAGYYYLASGDPRHLGSNPPLANVLSAAPLLLLNLQPHGVIPGTMTNLPHSFWGNGYRFLFEFRGDYRRAYLLARLTTVLLVAGLGVLLFAWGRALGRSEICGLLAAGLVWFSPGMLAHTRLVTTDAAAACVIALALWSLWFALQRPSYERFALCGACLGLAQLTKFYALLLYPVFLVLALAAARRLRGDGKLRRVVAVGLLVAFVLSLLVLNAGYLFHGVGTPLGNVELRSARMQAATAWLPGALPLPVPPAFVTAVDEQMVEVGADNPIFLLGETYEGGRWYYYLALVPLKTPLPLLLLFLTAAVYTLHRRRAGMTDLSVLLLYPLALFLVLSRSSQRQLGVRALLSAAPLVWLWVSVTLVRAPLAAWTRRFLLAVVLWAAAETAWAHPHYLAYFNPLAGGPSEAHDIATGSNLDWGQDLVGLKRYMDREGVGTIQLLYFGSVDPDVYDIDYEVPLEQARPGLLAVSVSLYHQPYAMYDHGVFRQVGPINRDVLGSPIATIAHTIHIYRIQ
jgi:4-amino-4-deoxy-L-arabinose transferase-like glycosyltransferase